MKKVLLLPALMLLAFFSMAQNCNLVVFAEGGERFHLILNGIQHNAEPQTNVKVEGLPEAPFKAKIIFEDRTLGTVEKTLYTTNNQETTYSLDLKGDSKTGKGLKKFGNDLHSSIGSATRYEEKEERYVLRMISQTPIASAPAERPAPQTTQSNVNNVSSGTTTHTSTTTTTTTSESPTRGNNAGVSMNINITENGNSESVGMDVNVNETSSTSGNVNMNVNESYSYTETTTTTTSSSGSDYNNSSSVGNGRCDYPMDNGDFNDAKGSIESKTFSDSKMTMAKQVTKANCPTAVQIRDFTKLFTYESDKLEYAKFAYDYCYDTGNYYKVNDAFEFESTIEELDEYISGK